MSRRPTLGRAWVCDQPVSVEVRRINADEFDVAGEVILAAYAPFTLGEKDNYVVKLRDVTTRDREAEVFVAVQQQRLVGCVTSCPPGSPWRELAQADEGEFRMLSVHPDARGLGVGHALVAVCEQRARDAGAGAMVLSSLPEMKDAHRLYERLGYRRQPDRDWAPQPEVDLIAYVKEFV